MIYVHLSGLPYKKYKDTYHLVADNIVELHEFALKIGLKKCWFQPSKTLPHYDVFGAMYKLAINNGAKLIDNKQIVDLIKKHRGK
jgi:hypothetical protein